MGTLAYIINLVGLGCMIGSLLMPGRFMKTILILSCLSNALVATGYLCAGSGLNGALSCYAGAVMILINFVLQAKKIKIPMWLLWVYALTFVALNLLGGVTWLSLVPIVATLAFVVSITRENGAQFRVCTLVNLILWCTYDILSGSYPSLIPHAFMLMFTIIGMLWHDRKKKEA